MTSSKRSAIIAHILILAFGSLLHIGLSSTQRTYAFFDLRSIHYPFRVIFGECIASGYFPLWSHELACGFPIHAEGEGGYLYPLTWLFALGIDYIIAFNLIILLSYWLAGWGMLHLANRYGLGNWGAVYAGLCYMGSGFLIAHLLQLNMIIGASLLPWLIAVFTRFWQQIDKSKTEPSQFLFPTLLIFLFFTGSHPQVTFYAILLLFVWQFAAGYRRQLLWTFAPIGLGMVLASAAILPTAELTAHSIRAGGLTSGEALGGSFFPPQVLGLPFPFLFGYLVPDVGHYYWGKPFFWEHCGYLGFFSLLLIGYACWKPEEVFWRRIRWVLLVALLFAFGKWGGVHTILAYLPGFRHFRVPARFLLWFCFVGALLAGRGLERFYHSPPEFYFSIEKLLYRTLKQKRTVIVVFSLLLSLVYFISFCFFIAHPSKNIELVGKNVRSIFKQEMSDNVNLILFSVNITTRYVFLLLCLVCSVFVISMKRMMLSAVRVKRGLTFLLCLDLLIFSWIYLPYTSRDEMLQQRPMDRFLAADTSDFRLHAIERIPEPNQPTLTAMKFRTPDISALFGIDSILTTATLRLKANADLLHLLKLGFHHEADWADIEGKIDILQLMGVKYLMTSKALPTGHFRLVFDDKIKLYRVPDSRPRAWTPSEVHLSEEQRLSDILSNLPPIQFPYPKIKTKPFLTEEVTSSRINIMYLQEFMVRLSSPVPFQSLILTQSFFPGWKVVKPNEKIRLRRSYHAFTAIKSERPTTMVLLEYRPFSFKLGVFISLMGLAIMIGVILVKTR